MARAIVGDRGRSWESVGDRGPRSEIHGASGNGPRGEEGRGTTARRGRASRRRAGQPGRDVLELHLRCAKSPGLQRLLDEKQDAAARLHFGHAAELRCPHKVARTRPRAELEGCRSSVVVAAPDLIGER